MAPNRRIQTTGPRGYGLQAVDVNDEIAALYDGITLLVENVAGTNDLTGNVTPTLDAWKPGQRYWVNPVVTNTGNVSLNVDERGVVSCRKPDGSHFAAGEFSPEYYYAFFYTGALLVQDATPAGQAGIAGISMGRQFEYDDETAESDPGDGKLRFDDPDPTAATEVYVDNVDRFDVDTTAWLDRMDDSGTSSDRGTLMVYKRGAEDSFVEYMVTGSVVDGGGHRALSVTLLSGNITSLTAGDILVVGWIGAGAAGGSESQYATLSALQAETAPTDGQSYRLLGRDAAGDGGEGDFLYDESDQSSVLTPDSFTATPDASTDVFSAVNHQLWPGYTLYVPTAANGLAAGIYYVMSSSEGLTDRTQFTSTIGNMTAIGGLAAIIDGSTNVNNGSCARTTAASANPGVCGVQLSVQRLIEHVVVYGSNNIGFTNTGGTVTIDVYGHRSASAPTDVTDTTKYNLGQLGSLSFTESTDESDGREVDCHTATEVNWIGVFISVTGTENKWCAEVVVYADDPGDFFQLASSWANYVAASAYDATGSAAMTLKKHVDPEQAHFVIKSGAALDGSEGCWIRQFNGRAIATPEQFGATPIITESDWNSGSPTLSSQALAAWLWFVSNRRAHAFMQAYYGTDIALWASTGSGLNVEGLGHGESGFFCDDCDGPKFRARTAYDSLRIGSIGFLSNQASTRTGLFIHGWPSGGASEQIDRRVHDVGSYGVSRILYRRFGVGTLGADGWATHIYLEQADRLTIERPFVYGTIEANGTGSFNVANAGISILHSTSVTIFEPLIYFTYWGIKARGQGEGIHLYGGAVVGCGQGIHVQISDGQEPGGTHNITGTHFSCYEKCVNLNGGGTGVLRHCWVTGCFMIPRSSVGVKAAPFYHVFDYAKQTRVLDNEFYEESNNHDPGADSDAVWYVGGAADGNKFSGNIITGPGVVAEILSGATRCSITDNDVVDTRTGSDGYDILPVVDAGTYTHRQGNRRRTHSDSGGYRRWDQIGDVVTVRRATSAQTGITTSTSTPVSWNSLYRNDMGGTGDWWDSGSPTIITIERAGRFRVRSWIDWESDSTGARWVRLFVDGSLYATLQSEDHRAASGTSNAGVVSAELELAAAQTISIEVLQASGADVDLATGSWLELERLN